MWVHTIRCSRPTSVGTSCFTQRYETGSTRGRPLTASSSAATRGRQATNGRAFPLAGGNTSAITLTSRASERRRATTTTAYSGYGGQPGCISSCRGYSACENQHPTTGANAVRATCRAGTDIIARHSTQCQYASGHTCPNGITTSDTDHIDATDTPHAAARRYASCRTARHTFSGSGDWPGELLRHKPGRRTLAQ